MTLKILVAFCCLIVAASAAIAPGENAYLPPKEGYNYPRPSVPFPPSPNIPLPRPPQPPQRPTPPRPTYGPGTVPTRPPQATVPPPYTPSPSPFRPSSVSPPAPFKPTPRPTYIPPATQPPFRPQPTSPPFRPTAPPARPPSATNAPGYLPPRPPSQPPYRPPTSPPFRPQPPRPQPQPPPSYGPPTGPRPTSPPFRPTGPPPYQPRPPQNGEGKPFQTFGENDHLLVPHKPGNPFDFKYAVKDEFGNDYSHNAINDGDTTQGEYRVQLPDGRTQVVKYTANWASGFHAKISYEGQPTYRPQPIPSGGGYPSQRPPGPSFPPSKPSGGQQYTPNGGYKY